MLNKNHMILSLALLYTAFTPCIYAGDNLEDELNPIEHILRTAKITSPNEKRSVHELIKAKHAQNNHFINAQNACGDTPLHVALFKRYTPATIYCLLELGADVTKANNDGITPLGYACQLITYAEPNNGYQFLNFTDGIINAGILLQHEAENPSIVAKNKQKIGSKNPLHTLMANENATFANFDLYPVIASLIDAGHSINAQDENGNTPAHYALIRNGEPYNIRALIPLLKAHRADFGIKNNRGCTPGQFVHSFQS